MAKKSSAMISVYTKTMQALRDVVFEYKKNSKGIGHFNISDSNQLHAIADAARETKLPVIIGLSEGEREFFPLPEVRAIIDLYQKEGLELFLNADHTYSYEKAVEAIDAGVDSIVVDGAKLSFKDNVMLLDRVVAYANHKRKFWGTHTLVEGELGYIGSSSNIIKEIPKGAAVTEEMMTKPEELKKLVEETGIDMAAPAVGNIHGIVTSGQPKLSISRIGELAKAVGAGPERSRGVPLVLHGGSGSDDEEFRNAIKAGMTIVHINTDIRVIYHDEAKKSLMTGVEVAPYKFLGPAMQKTKEYVAAKMQLFANP
jgi:fructose-bisphosphate aldolase class II